MTEHNMADFESFSDWYRANSRRYLAQEYWHYKRMTRIGATASAVEYYRYFMVKARKAAMGAARG